MHNHEPKEIGSAKMLLHEAVDKLKLVRDRLAMHKQEPGPKRARELHEKIVALEQIQSEL